MRWPESLQAGGVVGPSDWETPTESLSGDHGRMWRCSSLLLTVLPFANSQFRSPVAVRIGPVVIQEIRPLTQVTEIELVSVLSVNYCGNFATIVFASSGWLF